MNWDLRSKPFFAAKKQLLFYYFSHNWFRISVSGSRIVHAISLRKHNLSRIRIYFARNSKLTVLHTFYSPIVFAIRHHIVKIEGIFVKSSLIIVVVITTTTCVWLSSGRLRSTGRCNSTRPIVKSNSFSSIISTIACNQRNRRIVRSWLYFSIK